MDLRSSSVENLYYLKIESMHNGMTMHSGMTKHGKRVIDENT